MRRIAFLCLTLLTLSGILTGCAAAGQEEDTPLTPQERTELYKTAVEDACAQDGNTFVEIVTSQEDEMAEFLFTALELEAEDMTAYALAISSVNIQAYGIAAVYPAAGKEDDVLEALNGFIDTQKESFHQYLEQEYETASNTRLETLEDGTILMVMHPDQDTVFDAIRDTVEGAQT